MFLTLVICISSLDNLNPSTLLCKFLMIVRGVIHLVCTHEGERGLSKRVGHAYKVGGRGVETSKCVH